MKKMKRYFSGIRMNLKSHQRNKPQLSLRFSLDKANDAWNVILGQMVPKWSDIESRQMKLAHNCQSPGSVTVAIFAKPDPNCNHNKLSSWRQKLWLPHWRCTGCHSGAVAQSWLYCTAGHAGRWLPLLAGRLQSRRQTLQSGRQSPGSSSWHQSESPYQRGTSPGREGKRRKPLRTQTWPILGAEVEEHWRKQPKSRQVHPAQSPGRRKLRSRSAGCRRQRAGWPWAPGRTQRGSGAAGLLRRPTCCRCYVSARTAATASRVPPPPPGLGRRRRRRHHHHRAV